MNKVIWFNKGKKRIEEQLNSHKGNCLVKHKNPARKMVVDRIRKIIDKKFTIQ